MLKFLIFRGLYALPVLLGVALIVFIALHLAPGDVTQQILGLGASEERAQALRIQLGLDRPVLVQFFIWLGNLLQGDLGMSHYMNVPVVDVLSRKIGNSLILTGGSLFIVVLISFVLGTMSAARFRRPFDRFTVVLSLLLASMPVFWLGLIFLYAFGIIWPIFPTAGMYDLKNPGGVLDVLHHLVLPATATAAAGVAIMTRVTRASLIEVLGQPYIMAARARGLKERAVVYGHGVRNILPQFVNMTGLNVGFLFGSSVFAEVIFTWPGIGLQLYDSILKRDGAMVQGCVLAIAFVFVLSNLIADFVVYVLDAKKK